MLIQRVHGTLCSGALTLEDIREVWPPACRSTRNNMFNRVFIPQLYVCCQHQHRKHVGKHVIVCQGLMFYASRYVFDCISKNSDTISYLPTNVIDKI